MCLACTPGENLIEYYHNGNLAMRCVSLTELESIGGKLSSYYTVFNPETWYAFGKCLATEVEVNGRCTVVPCHESCDFCYGPGNTNCIVCNEGDPTPIAVDNQCVQDRDEEIYMRATSLGSRNPFIYLIEFSKGDIGTKEDGDSLYNYFSIRTLQVKNT